MFIIKINFEPKLILRYYDIIYLNIIIKLISTTYSYSWVWINLLYFIIQFVQLILDVRNKCQLKLGKINRSSINY